MGVIPLVSIIFLFIELNSIFTGPMGHLAIHKTILHCVIFLCLVPCSIKGQLTLTLQPGPSDGFDTPIGIWGNSNYGNMNFSFMSEILSKALTVGGNCSVARSLMRFDLSAIPANAIILSAKLSLYFAPGAVNPPHSGLNASYLKRVTSAWTNTTVTWNTQPSTTVADAVTLSQSNFSTQDYLDMNVTTMVAQMVVNPFTNYGFELGLQSESCDKILTFASSKFSDANKRPKLVVAYSLQPIGLAEGHPARFLGINSNSADGKFIVPLGEKDETFSVYALTGVLAYSAEIGQTDGQIDLSGLPAGLYLYQLNSSYGQVKSGRLIIP